MQISKRNRRQVLAGFAAAGCAALLPLRSEAMTQAQARSLIDRVMTDVHSIINSGGSESSLFSRFETLFDNYADVPIIARSALGPPARAASAASHSRSVR